MRICRLSIEGFRSISALDVELPQVCALVGANNTGKSNILDALNRVLGRDWVRVRSFTEEDVTWRDPEADITIHVEVDPPLQYRPFKYSDPVEVGGLQFKWTTYKRGEQKGERRLEQTPLSPAGKQIHVPQQAPRKGVQPRYAPLTTIPQQLREQLPLIHIGNDRSLAHHLPRYRYSLLQQLFDDVVTEFENPENTIDVPTDDGSTTVPRSERFYNILGEAMQLLRTDAFVEIERDVKRHALRQLGLDEESDSLDFYFGPLSARDFYRALDLIVREEHFAISATQLGHGVQNALVLAIMQVYERRRKQGAVFLIEEPEMFLHPQQQRALYKTMRSIGQSNQVVYVTHSPHFVSIPEYDEVILVTRGSEGTKVGRSSLSRTPQLEEKSRKELDPERNELFFANRLLLVEGDTEKLALPEYAERLGISLDLVGASIVEVGGKRNLPTFLDIAESFSIPTGVLYDKDSGDIQDAAEEEAFNASLDGRQRSDGSVMVWQLANRYEDHLRLALGEDKYQQLCQLHSGVSKAVRARLIAAEHSTEIPEPVIEVLDWLAGSRAGADRSSVDD